MSRAALLLAAVAAAALGLAACGGSETTVGASAAEIVPRSAALHATIDTDVDGEGVQRMKRLIDRFPDGDRFLQMLKDELASEDVSWERDVKPALGETLDIVVLTFSGDEPDVVAILKPANKDKLEELLRKGDEPSVHREIDGWTVVSDTDAVLDRFERAREGGTLEGDERFEGAIEGLPDDAFARLYVNGAAVTDAARRSGSPLPRSTRVTAFAMALAAESSGFRLDGRLQSQLESDYRSLEPYTPRFLEDVPADALLFASFNGYGKLGEAVRDALAGESAAAQIRAFLGMDLDELVSLFDGEVAFYVRPGAPIPEITLLLEARDEQRTLSTLNKLAQRLAMFTGAQRRETTVDGVNVQQLLIQGVPVSYGAWDGRVIVTNGATAIRDLRSDGEKLPESDAFEAATDSAEMPDETFGFFYVDVQRVAEMVSGYAGLAGESVPSEVQRNLEPLGAFLYWGSGEVEDMKLSAFLAIE